MQEEAHRRGHVRIVCRPQCSLHISFMHAAQMQEQLQTMVLSKHSTVAIHAAPTASDTSAQTLSRTMTRPRISCPVEWPKPHRAPSALAATRLRPIVSGVSACRVTNQCAACNTIMQLLHSCACHAAAEAYNNPSYRSDVDPGTLQQAPATSGCCHTEYTLHSYPHLTESIRHGISMHCSKEMQLRCRTRCATHRQVVRSTQRVQHTSC